MTIVQDFIVAANAIKFYDRNSKNIFKFFIVKKKTRDLESRLDMLDRLKVDKMIFIEFVNLYKGSFDMIQSSDFDVSITDNIYTLSIVNNNRTVFISTFNDINKNDEKLYIRYLDEGNIERKIDVYKSFDAQINEYQNNTTKELIEDINGFLISIIKWYILSYITL